MKSSAHAEVTSLCLCIRASIANKKLKPHAVEENGAIPARGGAVQYLTEQQPHEVESNELDEVVCRHSGQVRGVDVLVHGSRIVKRFVVSDPRAVF